MSITLNPAQSVVIPQINHQAYHWSV